MDLAGSSFAAHFGFGLHAGLRRSAVCAAALVLAACQLPETPRLDPSTIWVSSDVIMRTDVVGEGEFASRASFVLVDAENRGGEPAMVSLGGTFRDQRGQVVGTLRAESLWVPAGERRMFALVDRERVPRPSARGAQIVVSGARLQSRPPIMRVVEDRAFDDYGKIIVQGRLHNDADRPGRAMVFAGFYDGKGQPMARPFVLVPIDAHQVLPVQLVGPPGSRRGTMFLGDVVY